MGWLFEYWDGSNWVAINGYLEKLEQELNSQEFCSFVIANNETNRAIVAQDRDVRLTLDGVVQFKGLLVGAKYSNDTLACYVYNKCYEKMKSKVYTGTHSGDKSAKEILDLICAAAGVVGGTAPTTVYPNVRFQKAQCFDAAAFLAKSVNKDFWSDEDANGNPRFNIGDRGSSKGSVTPISWPDRGIDRSKKRDKVIIRGVDADGNYIEGSAGTGTNVAVFTEKKAADAATLNNIAAAKLAELNKESSGVALPVAINVAKNLFPGDTVTLNNSNLNLVGNFRIWKVTKTAVSAVIEVDKPQEVMDRRLKQTEQYEDLGIYPVPAEQIPDKFFDKTTDDIADIADVVPSAPALTFNNVVPAKVDTETEFRTWLEVTIPRVEGAAGYIVSYNVNGVAKYYHAYVEQPSSGNPVYITPDLLEDTSYDVKVCSVSPKGQTSNWSSTITRTTLINEHPPSVPTGLTATPVVDGVLLEWNAITATDFSHYKIYYGTSNPPTIVAGTSTRPTFLWKKKQTEAYTLYYFAVSAVDGAKVPKESTKTTAVSATPLQVKPVDLTIETRPWTSNLKMWEDGTTFGKLYWADPSGWADATVKFADGSTRTITKNTTGTSYPAGLRYFYWDTTDNTLKDTTDYGTAVGEGKGLIYVVDVKTDRPSTILPFNSYTPTIGAGAIAAKAIRSEHLITDTAVITQSAQIGNGLISSDHVSGTLGISSNKIILDGTTTFLNSWQRSGDATKIDGGSISTGTITAQQIAARSIDVEKLQVSGVGNELPDSGFESGTLNEWGDKHLVSVTAGAARTGNYGLEITHGGYLFSKYIPVKPNASYYFSVWVKNKGTATSGTFYLTLYWYNSAKTQLSYTYVSAGYSQLADWKLLEGNATLPGNAYYVRVRLYTTIDADSYADDVVLRVKEGGELIVDGTLKTRHIRFDGLANQSAENAMGYEAGKMWWRSDVDQLRFSSGTTLDKVAIIPKYPLYSVQAPPENMVPNQSFEFDRDGDGIPDYWTKVILSGSPTFERVSTEQYKGGYSAKISLSAAGEGKFCSEYIPVVPGSKIVLGVAYKGSVGKTHSYSVAHMEWYDQNKGNKTESNPPDDWKTTTTSWQKKFAQFTVPTGKYFARVALRNYVVSGQEEAIYYDDIVLSEIRASASSTWAYNMYNYDWEVITLSGGTYTTKTLNIPQASYNRLIVGAVAVGLNTSSPDTLAKTSVFVKGIDSSYIRSTSGQKTTDFFLRRTTPSSGEAPSICEIIVPIVFWISKDNAGSISAIIQNHSTSTYYYNLRIYCYEEIEHYHR